jgi:hypothetical protein
MKASPSAPAAANDDNQQNQQQQQNNNKLDSQESRQYVQKHRLWTIGEVLSFTLMTKKPKDPLTEILATLGKEKEKRTEQVDAPSAELVAESKQYVQELRIPFLIEDWYKNLIESRPEDPLEFSIEFFKKIQSGQDKKN